MGGCSSLRRSKLCTPLRGGRQATILLQYGRLRCRNNNKEKMVTPNRIGETMGILSLFQRKQKSTQAISNTNASLEKVADSILNKRGQQIIDGLNKPTASTGTPMKKLHGGAKKMAQMSNIGGGSKATGGGGVDEGMKAMLQYTQANTVKKMAAQNVKKKITGKK